MVRRLVIALVALAAIACLGPVKERVPTGVEPPEGFLSRPAVAELIGKELEYGLDDKKLASPDGQMRLVVVSESVPSVWSRVLGSGKWPDFFGIELRRADSPVTVPVMSLRECDAGSGSISLGVDWAVDSSAVRLKGYTRGYRRWGSRECEFDFLYVPDLDTFYDLGRRKTANRVRGSLSNYGLNPTVGPVTGLACASPAPVPPAG